MTTDKERRLLCHEIYEDYVANKEPQANQKLKAFEKQTRQDERDDLLKHGHCACNGKEVKCVFHRRKVEEARQDEAKKIFAEIDTIEGKFIHSKDMEKLKKKFGVRP